jgi:excisionase family DNA binding protein
MGIKTGKRRKAPSTAKPEQSRATLTIKETAKVLGIGVNQTYHAVKTGELFTIRIGGRLLVPRARLEKMLGG